MRLKCVLNEFPFLDRSVDGGVRQFDPESKDELQNMCSRCFEPWGQIETQHGFDEDGFQHTESMMYLKQFQRFIKSHEDQVFQIQSTNPKTFLTISKTTNKRNFRK